MKAMNGLSSTLMSRRGVIAAASMMGLGLAAGCSSSSDSGSTTSTSTTEETEEDSNKVGQPTDFELDLETGDFTFTATDENVGYYFVRLYAVKDGVETGDQIASSERINGGSTGTMSGNIDLSGVTYGDFNANLYAYPASGTDYEIADPVTLVVGGGADCSLERPEMLAMYSGNEVDLVVDWWTLINYYLKQYMPIVKFTFYSDAELTDVVLEEEVDTNELVDTLTIQSAADGVYGWGADTSEGVTPAYTLEVEATMFSEAGTKDIKFLYDWYTYNPGAGTYYVTVQALSSFDYINDSQESSAVEITLTDDEPGDTYSTATTELWQDPSYNGMNVTCGPSVTDRVDSAYEQTFDLIFVEE